MFTNGTRKNILIFLLSIGMLSVLTMVYATSFFNGFVVSSQNQLATGEWVPAQTAFFLHQNQKIYSNNESVSSYVDQNGEHFQLNIANNVQQFLSFAYRIQSEETAELFDNPTVLVQLDEIPILQILPLEYDTQWHVAFIDLSLVNLEPGIYDLLFLPQNSYDSSFEPSLEIKEVTTAQLFLKQASTLEFSTSKAVESVFVSYQVLQDNQQLTIQERLQAVPHTQNQKYRFIVPNEVSGTEISFWSVDLFGNTEPAKHLYIQSGKDLEITNLQLDVYSETENELNVQIQYLASNDSGMFFVAKVSQLPIITEFDWQEARLLERKNHSQFFKANVLYQLQASSKKVVHNLVFENLPTGQRYLTVKLCSMLVVCESFIENQPLY